jgi:hypothetical protein
VLVVGREDHKYGGHLWHAQGTHGVP